LAERVPGADPAAVAMPEDVSVIADRGYDSDLLRERLATAGF
jgi:hypothetical protein